MIKLLLTFLLFLESWLLRLISDNICKITLLFVYFGNNNEYSKLTILLPFAWLCHVKDINPSHLSQIFWLLTFEGKLNQNPDRNAETDVRVDILGVTIYLPWNFEDKDPFFADSDPSFLIFLRNVSAKKWLVISKRTWQSKRSAFTNNLKYHMRSWDLTLAVCGKQEQNELDN